MAGSSPTVVLLCGLSGAGKTTIARHVSATLRRQGRVVHHLDGDEIRATLSADLGFSTADRVEQLRRVGERALTLSAEHGTPVVVLCSLIAPDAMARRLLARRVRDAGARYLEIHVSTPLAVCESRDVKGLYAAARRGEITNFTGVSDAFAEPQHPDLVLDTSSMTVEKAGDLVLELLAGRGGSSPTPGRDAVRGGA